MQGALLFGLLLALSISTGAAAVGDDVRTELVPTGKLRVGVAYAPAPTPIFVAKDAAGDVHGVARDLGTALVKALDVPVELVVAATTGEFDRRLQLGRDRHRLHASGRRAPKSRRFQPTLFCDREHLFGRRRLRHQDA